MSNVKKAGAPKRTQAKKKKKFEDDRTPFVKKVDLICKLVAILLAICIFGSIHVLVGGGGYEDSKVVHVLGVAASKVQTDDMEPEIEARSAVFASKESEYKVGDVVQYYDEEIKRNPVRRIVEVSGDTYTVLGDNEDESKAVTITKEDISGGKVFFDSKFLYGIVDYYFSVLGCLTLVFLSFFLLIVPDLLMYKTRKAKLEERKAIQAKKEARKLAVKQGLEVPEEEENPIEKRKAEKQAKLEKERAEIAAEMKAIQKKMKAEEEELKKGKRGK